MAAWCEFEIIWMYGFDGRPLTADDIPEAVADLQTMGRFHGLQIYPDAEPDPDGHWQYPRVSVGWDREGESFFSGFALCGAGGVDSMRHSTSSSVGVAGNFS